MIILAILKSKSTIQLSWETGDYADFIHLDEWRLFTIGSRPEYKIKVGNV